MKRVVVGLVLLAALAAAGSGGYWLARHDARLPLIAKARPAAPVPSGPIIYYQDPDGQPFYAAEPKQTADGRPYRESEVKLIRSLTTGP